MEYISPWGGYLPLTGGIITGNLFVNGTLGAGALTSLNAGVNVTGISNLSGDVNIIGNTTNEGQLIIVYDDPTGLNGHILLRPDTVAGLFAAIYTQDVLLAAKSAMLTDTIGNMHFFPSTGKSLYAPSDVITPNVLWNVPYWGNPMQVRRLLLLHSLMS